MLRPQRKESSVSGALTVAPPATIHPKPYVGRARRTWLRALIGLSFVLGLAIWGAGSGSIGISTLWPPRYSG